MRKSIALMMVSFLIAGCAANQGALLVQSPLMVMHSSKTAGQVAGCASQTLNAAPAEGTDGINFWVTRSSASGVVVRYDMKPSPDGGSIVEYRSRLRINNGLDKVRKCL